MTNVNENAEIDVHEFIADVPSARRRNDAETLLTLLVQVTGQQPRMWYSNIVGFGSYHYKYDSGREGDAPALGFSPRKPAMSIYLADGIGAHLEALGKLGDHTTGVGCLYIKDFSKIDIGVLEEILRQAYSSVSSDPVT